MNSKGRDRQKEYLYKEMRQIVLSKSTAKDYITNYMDVMLKEIANELVDEGILDEYWKPESL